MFRVSTKATSELADMLDGLAQPDGYCLRLQVRDRELSLALDTPRAEDRRFSHLGQIVLVVDPDTLHACAGFVLDADCGELSVRQDFECN